MEEDLWQGFIIVFDKSGRNYYRKLPYDYVDLIYVCYKPREKEEYLKHIERGFVDKDRRIFGPCVWLDEPVSLLEIYTLGEEAAYQYWLANKDKFDPN